MILALDIFATGVAVGIVIVALAFGVAVMRGVYDAKRYGAGASR